MCANVSKKKILATIGVIVSVVIIFMGFLTIIGSLGGKPQYSNGASYLYDTGYATFGGDFYTYVNNNAAEAADAAYAVASNIRELNSLLKNVCGIFLMGFGLFGLCHFGMARCDLVVPAPEQIVADVNNEKPAAEESASEDAE